MSYESRLIVILIFYFLNPLTKDLIFHIIFLKVASTTKRLFKLLRKRHFLSNKIIRRAEFCLHKKSRGLKKPLLLCFYNIAFFIVVNREKCRTSIHDLPLRTWLLCKRKTPDHADRSKASSFQNCFYPTYAFA